MLEQKLQNIKKQILQKQKIRIMIIGLGSVGNYLLNYLLSSSDEYIEICVCGRDKEKMSLDVNIATISSAIRQQNKTKVSIIGDIDLSSIQQITDAINTFKPNIIVNSSRAYTGLKYGSISWHNLRAYGIWSPLAMRFTKNIMQAYDNANSDAIVINTSYSDATIPWLKSANKSYPDFGSGNINHLIPRIKLAVSSALDIKDWWNIDITFAVSHFHDVVISKEGHSEGIDMLIDIRYNNKKINININDVLAKCNIPMPTNATRNQMNASSNYEIIKAILNAIRFEKIIKLHCPGVFGEIGGYPVIINGEKLSAYFCEDYFTIEQMRLKNKESIYLDGIEDIQNGTLIYTDELIQKTKKAFNVELPKYVQLNEIEQVSDFIIKNIILRNIESK